MTFIEVSDGVTINVDKLYRFEEFRKGGTRIFTDDGETSVIQIPYDQFKQLVSAIQTKSNGLARDLNTLARSAYTPRP